MEANSRRQNGILTFTAKPTKRRATNNWLEVEAAVLTKYPKLKREDPEVAELLAWLVVRYIDKKRPVLMSDNNCMAANLGRALHRLEEMGLLTILRVNDHVYQFSYLCKPHVDQSIIDVGTPE